MFAVHPGSNRLPPGSRFRANLVARLLRCGIMYVDRETPPSREHDGSRLPGPKGHDETRSSSRVRLAIFGPFCTCNWASVWIFVCSSESHAVSCIHHLVRTIIDFRIQSRYLPYHLRSPEPLPGYKFWPSTSSASHPSCPFAPWPPPLSPSSQNSLRPPGVDCPAWTAASGPLPSPVSK